MYFATHPKFGELISLNPHDLIRGKCIFGSWGGGTNPDTDLGVFHRRLGKTLDAFKQLNTRFYRLDEINLALEDLDCGNILRPIVRMEH